MSVSVKSKRRFGSGLLLGAGLMTAGFYTLVHLPGMDQTVVARYTTGHPVEYLSITLFFVAATDLLAKLWRIARERRALSYDWLPNSDGAAPVTTAVELFGSVTAGPRGWQETYIARRLRNALHAIREKRTAEDIEDHLRYLSELDHDRSHASYGLVRVIAWTIPILGFLGTVIGITLAIANITPSQLETSLSEVTGGLAVAFDTTALALSLSIAIMFFLSVVEGMEQNVLHQVEESAHGQLAYRFMKHDTQSSPYLAHLQATGETIIDYTRRLVDQQTQIWAQTVHAIHEQTQKANSELESRLQHTIQHWQTHFEQQSQILGSTATSMEMTNQGLAKVSDLLLQVVEQEGQLVHSQELLSQNLSVLQQTQGFDEALNSLTAAIHLLTIRHQPKPHSPKNVA